MTRTLTTLLVVLLSAACGAATDDAPRILLADVEIAPPLDWQANELGADAATWTPTTNPRKESITVIVGPPRLGSEVRAIDRTRLAQGTLLGGHRGPETAIVNAHGIVGTRFDATFSPEAGGGRVYHRSHVVLAPRDGRTVHVLYTAADPEPTRAVLRRVVDSIHEGE